MRKDTPRPFTHPFQDEHSGSLCPHPLRVWRASACHRSGPDAFGGSERQRTLSGPGCIRVRCRGASAGGDRSHLMRLDDRRCLPVQCCTIFTIRARTWGRPTRHLAASSAPPPRTIIALRPLPGVLGWQGFQLARRVDGGSQRTRLPKNHRPMREHLCLNWHKPAEVFRQSRHPGSRPGYPTLPHACRASSPGTLLHAPLPDPILAADRPAPFACPADMVGPLFHTLTTTVIIIPFRPKQARARHPAPGCTAPPPAGRATI